MQELIDLFTLDAVGKSPAIFNPEKLLWLNAHYIKEAKTEKLGEEMKPLWPESARNADPEFVRKVINDLQPRAKTLVELASLADFYFAESINYENEAGQKFLLSEVAQYLKDIAESLPALEDFSKAGIENFLKAFGQERDIKLKIIAQPLRVALTGKTVSPGIDEVIVTLGKNRVVKRIKNAIAYIEARNAS